MDIDAIEKKLQIQNQKTLYQKKIWSDGIVFSASKAYKCKNDTVKKKYLRWLH